MITHTSTLQVNAGGQIDMHGRRYGPTWTNLAATAPVGATSIQVQDAVNQWQVGQQIVIVTTYYKDIVSNQNEVRTITAVSGNTVSFTQPLLFSHYGYVVVERPFLNKSPRFRTNTCLSRGPEYQAEVGLLSRNILVQGPLNGSVGPHIFVNSNVGRFSGVQTFRGVCVTADRTAQHVYLLYLKKTCIPCHVH